MSLLNLEILLLLAGAFMIGFMLTFTLGGGKEDSK